jgi:hypothetical protein
MRIRAYLAAVLLLAGINTRPQKTTQTLRFTEGHVNAKSYSKLTFSPDGALFLADSKGNTRIRGRIGAGMNQAPIRGKRTCPVRPR